MNTTAAVVTILLLIVNYMDSRSGNLTITSALLSIVFVLLSFIPIIGLLIAGVVMWMVFQHIINEWM